MSPQGREELLKELRKHKQKENKLSRKVNSLQERLKNKDNQIANLSQNRKQLENKIKKIKRERAEKDSKIEELKTELNQVQKSRNELKTQVENIFEEKEEKIKKLNQVIDKLKKEDRENTFDWNKSQEIVQLNYENSYLKKDLFEKENKLIEKNSKINTLEFKKEQLLQQKENLKEQYLKEQKEKNNYRSRLNQLKKKIESRFSPQSFTQYISEIIDTFNEEKLSMDSSIDYMIGEMEVDLKVEVSREDENISFSAPELASGAGEALSNFKFTVRAVPAELDE